MGAGTVMMTSHGRIRVVLCDDGSEERRALCALLAVQPDIDVVGVVEDGDVALGLLRLLKPDIALLDEDWSAFGGAAVARVGKRVRVVVADDHPSIRENLRYLLDSEPDLACAGVVKEPLRCVETCLEIIPDVLILDSSMPGVSGLSIARALRRLAPEIGIVFYPRP